jgi:hypothetical protein
VTKRVIALAALVLVSALAASCSSSERHRSDVARDVAAAREFARFPLYWVGRRFEGWELVHVDLVSHGFVSLVYGTCEAPPSSEPSCSPPLAIQIRRLCDGLQVVTPWPDDRIRGAPLGTNLDGAPVLLTNRVQVKVYTGQGAEPGLDLRALGALRSLNRVAPVVGADDPIPGASPSALDGTLRPCDSPPS